MSTSTRATRRSVAQVAAKLSPLNPRKGFTATKCLSGQSGAIRLARPFDGRIDRGDVRIRIGARRDGIGIGRGAHHELPLTATIVPNAPSAGGGGGLGQNRSARRFAKRVDVEPVREMRIERLPARFLGVTRHRVLQERHDAEGQKHGDDDAEIQRSA